MIKNFFLFTKGLPSSLLKSKYLSINFVTNNSMKLTSNKINNFNKFSFTNSNKTKFIQIIKDENNKNKIIYRDFDEYNNNENLSIQPEIIIHENNEKNKIKQPLKLKTFGKINVEYKNINQDNKSHDKTNPSNENKEFNVFNDSSELEKILRKEEEKLIKETHTEEIAENLLNYTQFFSDYCRVYLRAGDGGNGSISVLKGPTFDQGK